MKHPIEWLKSHPLTRPTRRQWIRILVAAVCLLLYGLLSLSAFLIVDGQPARRRSAAFSRTACRRSRRRSWDLSIR